MDLERVDPELREAVTALPGVDLRRPIGRWLGRAAPRLMRWPREPGVRIRRDRLGGVRVRTYAPPCIRSDAVLLWMHGGGMIIGAPHMDDRLCSAIAARVGIAVVSVDYRLAPEHPFPAPLDDCERVFAALAAQGRERIAVGGQSAGAGLAASLAQRLLDVGGAQPVAQLLFCPMLDDRTAARTELDVERHFVWDNRSNRLGWRALLAREPGAEAVPQHAVPARRDDLRGLPPAWIGVGDLDLFHEEDVDYAKRLRAAGVDVQLDVVPGAPHGLDAIAGGSRLAAEHRRSAIDWLARTLG
ncbi:alpha/beta hydrolase [Agrococcus sp. TSP3-2-1]|uniref:alpha/beta hydrolase n=1 Tax=Agrococcus sp. TSP3-2-1 TaxID=2804583 RepID=UPI003CF5F250